MPQEETETVICKNCKEDFVREVGVSSEMCLKCWDDYLTDFTDMS